MKRQLINSKKNIQMKKIIILFSAVFMSLVSCETNFLDTRDLDSVTEDLFFDRPQDFEESANGLYRSLYTPTGDFQHITDYGTELNGRVQDYGQGTNTPTAEDDFYSDPYTFIRDANVLIEKEEEFIANGGDADDIRASVATAYFFRAYSHFRLLKRFGGVPIVTEVTNIDSEVLFAPRNSRYEVVDQILADLDVAIAGLPETATGPDLGKISSIAATAYKARVLLYEGTWEKYVGTATDFEGSGAANNADAFIAQAVTAAREVIDSGQFEIFNQNADPLMEDNSYKWLFSLEGPESNPGSYTKADNREFIIQTIYDFDLQATINSLFTQINGGRNSPTQVALDMYRSSDGLPIDQSPLFQGYALQSTQFIDRDRRMFGNYGELLLDNGSLPIQGLTADSNTNLSNWKFLTFNSYRLVRTEGYNYPHLRYAEVLLTYAEALYERDGSISNEDLDISINLIRDRAVVAPLTNELVATNGLDMLEEIRNERTVELYMEDNSHQNDIRRWNVAADLLSADLIGYVIEGSEYETNTELFDPAVAVFGFVEDYPSGIGPVRAMIIDPSVNRPFTISNYLYPLPLNELVVNPALVQNPGF